MIALPLTLCTLGTLLCIFKCVDTAHQGNIEVARIWFYLTFMTATLLALTWSIGKTAGLL